MEPAPVALLTRPPFTPGLERDPLETGRALAAVPAAELPPLKAPSAACCWPRDTRARLLPLLTVPRSPAAITLCVRD
eukprot:scaffold46695_cov14-Tisochrysis_lutea.AAC.1